MSDNQKVFFKDIRKKILENISNTEFEIVIAVAWITDKLIIKELENCLKREVKIYILFYNDKINDKSSFKKLFDNGAHIKYTSKLMHNKFCVIDQKIVINGSYNWTNNANNNHENIQITFDSISMSDQYLEEFYRIFDKSKSINDYFKSEEDKLNEFISSFQHPKSFPLFIREKNRYEPLYIEQHYKLIKNEIDLQKYYENKFTYGRISKIGYSIPNNLYINIHSTDSRPLDVEDDYIYFTNDSILVEKYNWIYGSKIISIINKEGINISEEIHFFDIKINEDDILIITKSFDSIWYFRKNMQEDTIRTLKYKNELQDKRKKIEEDKEKLRKKNAESCYIATMVYGDINHPNVEFLRLYRDNKLKKHTVGNLFVKYYYRWSPKFVEKFRNHKLVNKIIKSLLDSFIKMHTK